MKKGYNIQIESWENDGDNYNIQTVVVQTIEEVRFYSEALKLFEGKFGNLCNGELYSYRKDGPTELGEELIAIFKELATKYGLYQDEPIDIYWISDGFISETVGHGEYTDARYCESVKVYYVPEDIKQLTKEEINA